MVPVIFVAVVYGVPALVAALLTAFLAIVVRICRSGRSAPYWLYLVVGTLMPILFLALGQHAAWPWPWWRAEALHDGIPPGPVLMIAAFPAWPLCLSMSRWIMVRPPRSMA
ncbi:hypothetical protein ACT009_17325 [Sphingomonas sp. Tas61C01]|uniref:hypothetical protein n=1 Tax=Sphingomonas sp. Tas61C01 TaxID=3458297 RepID=UPI00403EBB0E